MIKLYLLVTKTYLVIIAKIEIIDNLTLRNKYIPSGHAINFVFVKLNVKLVFQYHISMLYLATPFLPVGVEF